METFKTFLEYVANDMIEKWGTNLSRIAVVFPNKRAALFMNEFLARQAGKPMWSPAYITISDLFRKHSDITVGDPIKLICDLHKSFTKCTGLDETLDHFYGWGQLMLADFDDIDKNMADADKIFCNVKDIHQLDDMSYLTEEQREMLKRFFTNFTDNQETELKKRFLSLWSHFGNIYHDYNERLRTQGIGYEGSVYRNVAETKDIKFEYDKYIFVGFNLLQKVEQEIFSQLKQMGKAHFYWDFDTYYMPKRQTALATDAGHYIAMYLEHFPNELDIHSDCIYNNMRKPKRIAYITSPTESAQAMYANRWLRENKRLDDGRQTAIVMCDENMLLPLMHSLPVEAEKVNITSGFPLVMTPIASLVSYLFDLYTNGSTNNGKRYRATFVRKILAHPYAKYISDEAINILKTLNEQHIFVPDRTILTQDGNDEGLTMLFTHETYYNETATDNSIRTKANTSLLQKICDIIKRIGVRAKSTDNSEALFQESVFRMFTIMNRLGQLATSGDLCADTNTLRRLTKQLIAATSIPFHGEPIVGTQIMGVLETRNIDFKHVLLLSCNEGNMPKGVNDASFIPYSIRKAHGLTTIDNKVAIYSYYFHSLMQRAEDITIVYNNTTDNGHTGEMSRFMLQMLVNGTHTISHYNLTACNSPAPYMPHEVKKAGNILDTLNAMGSISPSAINKYQRCPLSFYYQYVARIKEPDAVDDTVDNRMFGNIFHKSAQLVYENITSHDGTVEKAQIQHFLKSTELLENFVDRAFDEELFKLPSGTTRRHSYNGLQIINRQVIIEYLQQLLKTDQQLAPFTILALEAPAYSDIIFTTHDGDTRRLNIGGIIDRLDMVTDKDSGCRKIRVIDYKTGNQATMKTKSIDDVFARTNISKRHSDYYLQAMLYSLIVAKSQTLNPESCEVSPALLFIKNASKEGYDPILEIDSKKITDVNRFKDEYIDKLKSVLGEIFSPNTPFFHTDDRKTCERCPYKGICQI